VSEFGELSTTFWSDFGVISFGDVSAVSESPCDLDDNNKENNNEPECGFAVGGRLATGGSLYISTSTQDHGWAIGKDLPTDTPVRPYAALIGRDFGVNDRGRIAPRSENILVGGRVSQSNPATPANLKNRVRQACLSAFQGQCLTLNFAEAEIYYRLLQWTWAWHPANCLTEARSEWDGAVLVISAAVPNQQRYYVQLDESVFSTAVKAFELIGFPDGAEFVVTIRFSGNQRTLAGISPWPSMLRNTTDCPLGNCALRRGWPGRTVFNLIFSGELILNGARLPNVLAPDASITIQNGRIQGSLIAGRIRKLGSVAWVDCNLPETPLRSDLF
jgi:choice-of-anchor A domain-containing protein